MTQLASTELVFLLVLREWCGERFLYQMHSYIARRGEKKGKEKRMFYVKFMLLLQH